MLRVTREQKLALIVGFSLILLVGVLISDHLSSARKATIAKVEPEPAPINAAPYPVAPPQTIAERRAEQPSQAVANTNPAPANPPSTTPVSEPPTTIVALGGEPRSTSAANPDPVQPSSSRAPDQVNLARSGESSVIDEIHRAGGEFVRGPDGYLSFRLPPAASISPSERSSPRAEPPRITQSPVGLIETVRTHSVQAGESLYQIAAKYYGNGNLWRDLVKYNSMDKTGTVRTGMRIKVPSKDTLLGRAVANTLPTSIDPGIKLIKPPAPQFTPKASLPKAAPGKPGKIELASYIIKRGDTLGEISQRTLGTSKRWQEIVDLNNLDDEDNLTPGAVLKIPARRS